MKNIITLLLLVFCCSIFGQNRIPQNGETIVFYPLNKGNNLANEGYDCFYSFPQVTAKGKYDFKSKFRFKKNASNVTPSSEIEGYTFYVENQETINENGNDYLLLFLMRYEDKENVILRVPKFIDKKSNVITQSFVKNLYYDYDLNYRKKLYCNIVLPFINAEALASLKSSYKGKEIIYGIKKMIDGKSSIDRNLDLKELTRQVNGSYYNFFNFEYDTPYNCSDIDFFNISNDLIYNQLCASIQIDEEDVIFVPVTYLVGNTDLYDKRQNGVYCFFDYYFFERGEYLKKEFSRNNCLDAVNKYTGKKVYYGLHKLYKYKGDYSKKFEAYENRVLYTDELYTIKEGVYDCLRFDVIKRFDKDFNNAIPYAILKDSSGVEFRVPANSTFYGRAHHFVRTEKFEEYFVLAELVDSIVQQRAELKLKKELAEKNLIRTLTNKYGKSYADFLIGYGGRTIARFETLAKKYGKVNAKLIIERRVKLGWSEEMCRESWGDPSDINTTTGSWGVHEQWVYEVSYEDYYNMRCLYFENGILTTIQD